MDADWYVDPLGRYDGRFFDGQMWTERVSSDGRLTLDPDWPPREEPAVAPLDHRGPRRATTLAESPVRTVAVLDDLPVANSDRTESRRLATRRAWVMLAAIAALVAIVVLMIVTNNGDNQSGTLADQPVSEPIDLDDLEDLEPLEGLVEEEAPVVDTTDQTGLAVDPAADFAPSERIDVGALTVVNGESVLLALEAWHRGAVGARDITLASGAGCWFGELGGAAVQTVQCGPVAGTADTEYLYDLVPLRMAEIDAGHVAQPVVEAVTVNTVLANGLDLVGRRNGPPPPVNQDNRGDRGG